MWRNFTNLKKKRSLFVMTNLEGSMTNKINSFG